jgi:hypothetical protein
MVGMLNGDTGLRSSVGGPTEHPAVFGRSKLRRGGTGRTCGRTLGESAPDELLGRLQARGVTIICLGFTMHLFKVEISIFFAEETVTSSLFISIPFGFVFED